ncbi:Dps family protein [Microterricola viridarii]|uniref:DNA starvation/stationary phase protection protein n=1 Tax=Microterricola viridarii TaxID=412690 RepID=A0A0X8E4A3_9MICO|nr:DNA starvation/stationary phase protection protein [Microterricola viridarii]AMB59459.1 DNA starvation/stationary phase protection protein [Microterricola viridarii]
MTDTLERGTRKSSRTQSAVEAYTAPKKLSDALQKVLVELLELQLQGKQAHWNVIGHNFRDLHLQLDEIIKAARGFSDTVAERMRALHAVPDGRSDTIASTTTMPAYPAGETDTAETVDLITARLHTVAGTARAVHDVVDAADPTSADILHTIIEKIEQYAWMVGAENRTP